MPSLIGRCGGGCSGLIDSTATAGDECGVHSVGATAGFVLTADGAGGSDWAASGGGSLAPDFSLYRTAVTSVSAGGSTVLSWQYVSGTALLDLTTPTTPTTPTRGVYAVMANVAVTGGVVNNGRTISAQLQMGSGLITFVNGFTQGDATTAAPDFCLTGVHPMLVNNPLSLSVNNHDSASRNVQGQNIGVCLIFAY